MSETLITNKPVYDEYELHTQHLEWDKNCSTCYKEKKEVLNKTCGVAINNSNHFELAEEKSAHPENRYW